MSLNESKSRIALVGLTVCILIAAGFGSTFMGSAEGPTTSSDGIGVEEKGPIEKVREVESTESVQDRKNKYISTDMRDAAEEENLSLKFDQSYENGSIAATSVYEPDPYGTDDPELLDMEAAENFWSASGTIRKIGVYGLALYWDYEAEEWREETPDLYEPFDVRFYEGAGPNAGEPDWDNPDKEWNLDGERFVEDDDWHWETADVLYRYEIELPEPLTWDEGWVSVQMDNEESVTNSWILWMESPGEGDGQGWQRARKIEGGEGSTTYDQLSYDLAFELWGDEIRTEPAAALDLNNATLKGNLTGLAEGDEADVFFRYRRAGDTEWSETPPVTKSDPGTFTENLTDLSPMQEYEFQAVGEVEGVEFTGDILSFTPATVSSTTQLEEEWKNYEEMNSLKTVEDDLALDAVEVGSETFNFTGEKETVDVSGYSQMKVEMWGAGGGGEDGDDYYAGGDGGYVEALLNVSEFDELDIWVGEGGGYGGPGGWGRHNGGDGDTNTGGGGGSTEIVADDGTFLAAADAGGGAGYLGWIIDYEGGGGARGGEGYNDGEGEGRGGDGGIGGSDGAPGSGEINFDLLLDEAEITRGDGSSGGLGGDGSDGLISTTYYANEYEGERISEPISLDEIESVGDNVIDWTEEIQEGTNVTVYTGISGDSEALPETWDHAEKGEPIPSIDEGEDLTGRYLWTRQVLTTTDASVTPRLSDLRIGIIDGLETLNLEVRSEKGGTTDPAPGNYTYMVGDEVTVQALPDDGWIFDNWTGDVSQGEEDQDEITMTMDTNKEVTAHFLKEATFEVEILSPEDGDRFIENESVEVEYRVNNTGDFNDTQTIALEVDDEQIDTNEVTLESGESYTDTFTWEPSENFIGENNVFVSSDDDQDNISVTVLEEGIFYTEIIDSDEEVVEGESASVTSEITNTGNEEVTQDVSFVVYDQDDVVYEDTETVTLQGEETSVEAFTWQTEEGEAGEYETVVASEGSEDRVNLTVLEDAYFDLDIVDFDEEVLEGDTAYVNFTVMNTGEVEGTKDVEISIYDENGESVVEEHLEITLTAGEEKEVSFPWETEEGDAGNYDAVISSEDAEQSVEMVVLPQIYFEVEMIDYEDNIVEGDDLEVTVEVENTGVVEATQDIKLLDFNGDVADVEGDVELGPGESTEITLTWQIEEGDEGTDEITVASEDETVSQQVTIETRSPHFEVEVTDHDEEAVEGEELLVNYTVTNTGNVEDTQTIEVSLDGALEDSEEVTLGPGEDHDGEFSWQTEEGDAGEYDIVVASEDEEAEITVTVMEPAFFEVEIEDYDEEVVEGEEIVIDYTISNTGDVEGSQLIEIRINGEVEDGQEIDVSGGEDYDGEFKWQTEEGDAGEYDIVVASEDEEKEITASVLKPAFFEVEIGDYEEEVVEGEEVVVDYTVTNTGDVEATRTIEFRVDGTVEDSEEVTLGPGEVHDGEFTWQTEEGDAGEYTIGVLSEDDDPGDPTAQVDISIEEEQDILFWVLPILGILIVVIVILLIFRQRKEESEAEEEGTSETPPVLAKKIEEKQASESEDAGDEGEGYEFLEVDESEKKDFDEDLEDALKDIED
ncbi:MAG: CARDB domain-containing protein [Candidatus Natronoplasma sp.]